MDPSAEHSAESYRLLFGLLGGALLVMVLLFIVASALIAPVWAVVALGGLWVLAVVVSIASFRARPWVPLVAGTAAATVWIAAITIGSASLGWRA